MKTMAEMAIDELNEQQSRGRLDAPVGFYEPELRGFIDRLRSDDGVRAMLSMCEETLRERELNSPPGAKREYLCGARRNALRALRSLDKAMQDAANGGR